MSTVAEILAKTPVPDFPPDELLIAEDGVPLESDWHRIEISLLVELCAQAFAGREDYFAGGNMFIYFNEEHIRNRDFRGPDFFFVWGANPMPLRPYWAVWKEGGRYPNLIVELLSVSTADEDLTVKKDIYEKIFRTPEYYCFDPETRLFQGWRLDNWKYRPIQPNEKGWLWSEQLQLWLGLWDGVYLNRDTTWVRLYTKDGVLIPTNTERAEEERRRAEEERRRADALQAELDRLKANQSPNGK